MKRPTDELVDKLGKAHGDKLVSVVLYGSSAVGERDQDFSDVNILCVLSQLGVAELAASERTFRWWRDLGNPSPLLLTEQEVHASTDCFPIEFLDIQQQGRVLFGKDIVTTLVIDPVFYRARVEFELRAKLLRLRQKAGGVMGDAGLLLRLMADSVSTFGVLARHALRLAGHPAPSTKRETFTQAGQSFHMDPAPFLLLLDVRDRTRKPTAVEPVALLGDYLQQIQVLVDAVDRLER